MRKSLKLLLVALILLTAGCMDYEEYLVLNKDGTGSMEIHYSVDKSYLEQMQQMGVQMGGEKLSLSDMAAEMSPFDSVDETSGSGTKVVRLESSETDMAFVWDMKIEFEDFAAFNDMSSSMPGDENEMAETPGSEISFTRQDDGTWLFTRSLDQGEENEGSGAGYGEESSDSYGDVSNADEITEEIAADEDVAAALGQLGDAMEGLAMNMQKQMTEAAAEHMVRLTVQFPGDVIESNATKVDGNVATWEYPLDQITSAPPAMRATTKD